MGQPSQIRRSLKPLGYPSKSKDQTARPYPLIVRTPSTIMMYPTAVLLAFALLLLFATATLTTEAAARQTSQYAPQTGAPSREIANLRSTKAKPSKKGNPPPWIALGVNKSVPSLEPGVECPLSQVVGGVSQRMKELIENLQKFDATEHLEHFSVGASGPRGKPETRKYDYVAIISPSVHGEILLEEYRNGTVDLSQFPGKIATTGLSAMALIFHPINVSNFNVTCEGRGQWDGHLAWLVDFVQRSDRPNGFSSYMINDRNYPVPLKGRAWIDAGTYQVRRLETEMMKPNPEIKLNEQDMAIDYGPVQFRTNGQQLWLPLDAEVYSDQRKHRFYRRHTFSNFRLFEVGTAQQIQAPKESYCFKNTSHQDIAGVLSVSPISGISEKVVSVHFRIASGRRVCKTVGPGKDVNMPVDGVGSAIFRYDGAAGSITDNSILPNGSTLDLIPESSIAIKP